MRRLALVTGGTRGLGRQIAIDLQRAGNKVVVVYHNNEVAAREFTNETAIPTMHWDVSDFDACRVGIAHVERDFGPIGILVNDAGITRDAMLHRMTPQQWQQVLSTNLDSMFNMCRNVVEGMRERGYGRIVNISSITGEKGQIGQVNYAAAKSGILGFTKALALECARKNITVNAVAPGYCDTEMVAAVAPDVMKSIIDNIPVGRLGTPADIARMVTFLADEHASFITGATFEVNGGQYMS
jgi:acetoacetyl-CoA reductase